MPFLNSRDKQAQSNLLVTTLRECSQLEMCSKSRLWKTAEKTPQPGNLTGKNLYKMNGLPVKCFHLLLPD